jgi:hypothetical protein
MVLEPSSEGRKGRPSGVRARSSALFFLGWAARAGCLAWRFLATGSIGINRWVPRSSGLVRAASAKSGGIGGAGP